MTSILLRKWGQQSRWRSVLNLPTQCALLNRNYASSAGKKPPGTCTFVKFAFHANDLETEKDQEDLIRNLGLWLELLDLGHYLDQVRWWNCEFQTNWDPKVYGFITRLCL